MKSLKVLMSSSNYIEKSFEEARKTLEIFSNEDNYLLVHQATELMISSIQKGGKLLSCGNGGSLCDAKHFAEELTGRFRKERPSLPAIALADSGHISCVGNDYGYAEIFARYVEGLGQANDLLLSISTSGNSENVIKATIAAKNKGMKVVGLLGKDGGKLKSLVDIPIIVPGAFADRIQEVHIKIIHTFIEGIERSLYPHLY